jgi:hypothetical protein
VPELTQNRLYRTRHGRVQLLAKLAHRRVLGPPVDQIVGQEDCFP